MFEMHVCLRLVLTPRSSLYIYIYIYCNRKQILNVGVCPTVERGSERACRSLRLAAASTQIGVVA
jgi:hypothetical protein